MRIKVINVEVTDVKTDKGGYKKAEVTYKDGNGKTVTKFLTSFGDQKEAFTVLVSNKKGVFDVKVEQKGQYWNWTKVVPVTDEDFEELAQAAPAAKSTGNATPRSTYETPEERAEKQKYIIRQSMVNAAINLLTLQGNKKTNAYEVMDIATIFEKFVYEGLQPTAADAFAAIEKLEDDIPY